VYRRVVVPVSGGHTDEQAIDIATSVANRGGSNELILVYVVEVPQRFGLDADLPNEIDEGESILGRAKQYARSQIDGHWDRVLTELLQARFAASAIVDEAIERGAQVIVLATVNQRRFGATTQGDTVPYVLDNAPCDVLLLRERSEDGTYG
jgi:nucleotide-binding universal stress UspA family protein